MNYSEIISTNQGFQTSVNLELDLNKKEKVEGYIPTEQSVKVLGQFLKSFYYDTDTQNRASVLIGPYGRGKSHLLLVLTALTSMDVFGSNDYSHEEAKVLLGNLCNRIMSVSDEVGALAKAVVESEIRTLPVVINSNSRDINQAFLVALNNALSVAGLNNLLPKTYFDSAYDVIKKWEKDIPDAYTKFSQKLADMKETVERVTVGLKQFDNSAYDLFCRVYPEVAAGMTFNPLMSMDVVKLYRSVVDALCEQTKYQGINIIFDEFSKFLESNLEKSQMYNLKIIQDLAEAASRSGKKQIHFTCITHKDILEYSSSDSFKTVEGRFTKIYFVSSSEQSYELISNAIVKKKGFDKYIEEYKDSMMKVADVASRVTVFRDLEDDAFEKKVVYGCFPLAPLTVYALLKISELVGQNERTLFTFLASDGDNTLREFLKKEHNKLEFITVDVIFDYFEELFRKEVFNASVHSCWAKANSAIRQLDDVDQIKIVKAVSVINMIKDGVIKTIPTHIKAALLLSDTSFDKASDELQRQHIMTQRDSSEFVLLTANGVDVQKSILNQIESKAIKVNVCAELNGKCDAGYVIPHEHNDKKCILRCFKKVFIDADTFCRFRTAKQILNEYPYDGVIFNVIDQDGSKADSVKEKILSFAGYPQIIACISKVYFSGELLLKKMVAAAQIKEIAQKNKDVHYLEEIEYFEEDLHKQIISLVVELFAPASKNSEFINCNGTLRVTRQASLINEVSSICDEVYESTPVVNNEMVNKKVLNAQNLKGRDIVVSWILEHSDDAAIPCMDGFGPEVSIFKSAFSFTGLDTSTHANDIGLNNVISEIQKFIVGCEKKRGNFKDLYSKLMEKPYGMRKGIIPLYLAYVVRTYKENIVLYFSDKEVELSAAVLGRINDSPERYEMIVERGTKEKDGYLSRLDSIFKEYKDPRVLSANRVYSIMRSMQNWYRALPEYTKKYTFFFENGEKREIPEYYKVLRSDLAKYDLNSREVIFEKWISALSSEKNLSECHNKIADFKAAMDLHIINFRKEISKSLIAVFSPDYKGGLPKAANAWYKRLPDSTKQHVFDANCNALLTITGNVSTFDENDFLDNLVNVFETIGIEDWNDNLAGRFIAEIAEAVGKIVAYEGCEETGKNECKVMISMPGIEVEKNFATDDISPLAKTALNNMAAVFDEYNDALEPDEKIAILAQLIGKVIQ